VLRTDPQVQLEVRTPDQYQGGWPTPTSSCSNSVTPSRAGPGRFIFINAVPPDVPRSKVLGSSRAPPTIMGLGRKPSGQRHVEFAKVTSRRRFADRPLAAGRARWSRRWVVPLI